MMRVSLVRWVLLSSGDDEAAFYTTGAVIMDSAFCIIKAVVEMRRRGVFAATVSPREGHLSAEHNGR